MAPTWQVFSFPNASYLQDYTFALTLPTISIITEFARWTSNFKTQPLQAVHQVKVVSYKGNCFGRAKRVGSPKHDVYLTIFRVKGAKGKQWRGQRCLTSNYSI